MANLVYNQPETVITWLSSTGTNVITLTSLATVTGRQGATHDFGPTTARSRLYEWRAWVQFATAPVVGETVDIYLKRSNGTQWDNDDGEGDIALSASDKLLNCQWLGAIVVDEAAQDIEMSTGGLVLISAQEIAPIFYNATVDSLTATALEHGFSLSPVPDEIQ